MNAELSQQCTCIVSEGFGCTHIADRLVIPINKNGHLAHLVDQLILWVRHAPCISFQGRLQFEHINTSHYQYTFGSLRSCIMVNTMDLRYFLASASKHPSSTYLNSVSTFLERPVFSCFSCSPYLRSKSKYSSGKSSRKKATHDTLIPMSSCACCRLCFSEIPTDVYTNMLVSCIT